MLLHNTVPTFLHLFEQNPGLSEADLQSRYHQQYDEIFTIYFRDYVRMAPGRIASALERYPADLDRIRKATVAAPGVLEGLLARAGATFGFEPPTELFLLVGVYASNAWVDRKSRLGLAVERAPEGAALEVLLAHELCHRYHFAYLAQAGYDWKRPITTAFWAYLEGIATHYSRLLCPNAADELIFCHDPAPESQAWVRFARETEGQIGAALRPVLGETDAEVAREWFKLSGGQLFGHNRLGYYMGTRFIEHLAEHMDIREIMTLVQREPVEPLMERWLATGGAL